MFRDKNGFILHYFTTPLVDTFYYIAQLHASILVIKMAAQRKWTRIWIESDWAYMVSLISSRAIIVPWNIHANWIKCCHTLSNLNVIAMHIFREGNRISDALPLHGRMSQTMSSWPITPPFSYEFFLHNVHRQITYIFIYLIYFLAVFIPFCGRSMFCSI